MELPQYQEPFKHASIDGIVLIKHVDETHLEDMLGVNNELHLKKIMNGIHVLQKQYQDIENEVDKRRMAELSKREMQEEESERRAAADLERLRVKVAREKEKAELKRIKKEKDRADAEERERVKVEKLQAKVSESLPALGEKDKKIKKKKGSRIAGDVALARSAATSRGITYDQKDMGANNEMDRIRMSKSLRDYKKQKDDKLTQILKAKSNWKFQYTGDQEPESDYEETHPWHGDKEGEAAVGSVGYQKMMATDMLMRPTHLSRVRLIPANYSPEEILVAVKGAMFEVSEWLLKVEKVNMRRADLQDRDLEELGYGYGARGEEDTDGAYGDSMEYLPQYEDNEGERVEGERVEGVWVEGGQGQDEDDDDDLLPSYRSKTSDQGEDILNPHLSGRDNLGGQENRGEEEEEGGSIAPPSYSRHDLYASINNSSPSNNTFPSNFDSNNYKTEKKMLPDRISLLFNAFVKAQNNKARWLGKNEKLTRLKLHGGIERVLKLKMNWQQFDAMWTKMDRFRSGDIDIDEFKLCFGDVADFKSLYGVNGPSLSLKSGSEDMKALSKCLYELCDVLRHAGFTVKEMFNGFDRNASGKISISEFCSMLRFVVGSTFDKRIIFRAISVLDSDGDKNISLEEFLMFVYKIWRSQLQELSEKCSEGHGDEKLRIFLKERDDIKDAVKRNYPRSFRDKIGTDDSVPGPFSSLLIPLGMTQKSKSQNRSKIDYDDHYQYEGIDETNHLNYNLSPKNSIRNRPLSPADRGVGPATSLSSSAPLHGHVSGQNQLLRFKIRLSPGNGGGLLSSTSHRRGQSLSLPTVKDLNRNNIFSGERTSSLLRNSEPGGTNLFTLSS